MAGPTKTIGELNGRWSGLFKISQIITPVVGGIFMLVILPWCIWVTTTVYHLEPDKPRYSFNDAAKDRAVAEESRTQLMFAIDKRFDALPPDVWQNKIKMLEATQRELLNNQIKILTILGNDPRWNRQDK